MTGDNLENLLRQGLPASPGHKEMLRRRLFEDNTELSADDLEQVVGGVAAALPEQENWMKWPEDGNERY